MLLYRKMAQAASLDDEGNDKDATFANRKEQDTEVIKGNIEFTLFYDH